MSQKYDTSRQNVYYDFQQFEFNFPPNKTFYDEKQFFERLYTTIWETTTIQAVFKILQR